MKEFSRVLRSYGISRVRGDAYAGSWPSEGFSKMGISYEPSAEPKARIYQSLLPLLNSRRVRLLDEPRLVAQLLALERRTARGGRESIDHPPRGDLGLSLGWPPTEASVREAAPASPWPESGLARIGWRR